MREADRCEVVLNNRSANPIDVTPIFYTIGGNAIMGAPVQLQPAEIRFIPVEKLMPESLRKRHRWGGMALSYTGNVLEVWAQITFHGVGGGSVDETFNILEEPGSDTREAVWRIPQRSTAVIALGNSSDSNIRTTAQFSSGESETIDIPAGMTKFIRRHAGQREIDSVKLTNVGPEGSLRVMGFVVASDNRFASSIRFNDTKRTVQANIFATNLRLKDAEPRIVLKNTSDAQVSARPHFFSVEGGQADPVELPAITLAPQEVVDADLSSLRRTAASRTDFDSVSVQVLSSGAPGALIGAAYSSDRISGLTYDVPLRDSGKVRNLTGSYPWRIDDDYSTIVSITNVGERPARFQVEIRYPGGPYSIKPAQLEPGQTAVFDLRRMKEEKAPDRSGKALTVESGQFHWSVVATPGEARLIGRAEVVSRSARVASSYSCPTCCPDSGPYGGFNPNSYTFYVDGFIATSSSGDFYDCYWNYYPSSLWWTSLETSEPPVATFVSGTEQLYGEGAGYTYGIGSYDRTDWWTDNMDCYQQYFPQTDWVPVAVAVATVESDVLAVRPTGTGGTSTATIKVLTDPPFPGQSVQLTLSAGNDSGGHVSHSGTRPLGTLAATQGTTNAQGIFETTYTGPIFGGSVTISSTLNGSPASNSVEVLVVVEGLSELGASADYSLVGQLSTHPNNHFGSATALTNLPLIATDYLSQYPGADILRFNDMSLVRGGKFELSNDWSSSFSHDEHRIGINCDVYSANVPTSRWDVLKDIFRARQSPNFGDETAALNHWHLRFSQ